MRRVFVVDHGWRMPSQYGKCRASRGGCPNPPVADLARSHSKLSVPMNIGGLTRWWAYCADHMYGRVIIDGEIYVGVGVGSPAAIRGHVGRERG